MSTDLMSLIVPFVVLFGLMAFGSPVWFALTASGTVGIGMVTGWDIVEATVVSEAFTSAATYTLVPIPMFILMGLFISNSGLIDRLFDFVQRFFRVPGGLALSTIASSGVFGAISGSSVASTATIGRVAIPQMTRRGYPEPYAAAVVAVGGTLGVMIPPSIILMVYGVLAEVSIGALLLAGILPGILSAVTYGVLVYVQAIGRQRSARTLVAARSSVTVDGEGTSSVALIDGGSDANDRSVPGDMAEETEPTDAVAIAAIGALFALVMGGIYFGFFTVTEASAVGAFGAAIIGCLYRLLRTEESAATVIRTAIGASLTEAARVTAMIFMLIVGASVFTQYLILGRVPDDLSEWILGFDVHPLIVIAALLLLTLPMGMFIDGLSILLIMTPIVAPIVIAMGYDGIWLGILLVKTIEIGLLTPPVGMNVFVVSGLSKTLTPGAVFRRIWPFVTIELALLGVLFAFPEISLLLPNAMD